MTTAVAADTCPAAQITAAAGDMQTAAAQATSAAATVPIHRLQLSSQEPLYSAKRQLCPNCKKTRAFFCYDCLTPLVEGIPCIADLPVDIHIVMHGETNAQATGTHAAMIAPIKLFRHTDGTSHHRRQPASKLLLPDWDPATTAVLYPEGPETPVAGLWGQLQQPGQLQEQQRQICAQVTGGSAAQLGLKQRNPVKLQEHPAGPAGHLQQCQGQCCACDSEHQLLHHWDAASACTKVKHLAQSCCQAFQGRRLQDQVVCMHEGVHRLYGGQDVFGVSDILQQQFQQQFQQQCLVGETTQQGVQDSRAHPNSCAASKTAAAIAADVAGADACSSVASAFPYKTVVVLEGNWAKARTLLQHPKIAPLPRIQLPLNVRSLFWRRGTGSFRAAVDCGVCTIEAVYLLLQQLQPEPAGKWDDLLWFFSYQRQLVQQKGSYQTRREMQQNFEAACGR